MGSPSRVLVIGGTGFIGPHVVSQLVARGEHVAVLHRGVTSGPAAGPAGVERITGDRRDGEWLRGCVERFAPDVVVDLILSSGRQSDALADALDGRAGRLVIASSIDVYRSAIASRSTPMRRSGGRSRGNPPIRRPGSARLPSTTPLRTPRFLRPA
jgi:nucleoside-diphosphate-sugar epimerase